MIEKPLYGLIYSVRCTVNDRRYVGLTTSLKGVERGSTDLQVDDVSRWKNHLQSLQYGKHPRALMQADFNLYGEDSFEFSVLEWCESWRELQEAEIRWQVKLTPVYSGDFVASMINGLIDTCGIDKMAALYRGEYLLMPRSLQSIQPDTGKRQTA